MSKFIVGEDCKVYYEDETGKTTSHELESDSMYKITVQAKYIGFEDNVLVFDVEEQEIYVPLNTIKNIE